MYFFTKENPSQERQAIIEQTQENMMISMFNLQPEKLSNLAFLFQDIVSPNTLKIAHERYFPYAGIYASSRKQDELRYFKNTYGKERFKFLDYFPLAGCIATAFNSFFISNHLQRHFHLGTGRIPTYITAVGFPSGFSFFTLYSLGYSYYSKWGLPDCLPCHSATVALSMAAIASVYPLVTASLMSIHFSHITSTKIVPVDVYSSKTSFFKAISLAKDIALRGRFLPIFGITSAAIGVGSYYATEKQYEEFISLFSLACHFIENPSLFVVKSGDKSST